MTRDLTPLFEPETLAVVGVSADPGKWGYWFARDAALGAHRRRVYLVGRNGGEVHGMRVYRSLGELPEPPELVVLSVPADGLEEAVDASLAAGARALVAIAAGFAELGEDGAARERALVERVRAAGAALVGPNCLGVVDGAAELQLASTPLPAGPIGFVSQSGNILLEVGMLLEDYGLGFSRAVSIGNQADVDATELVAALGEHEATRVIGVYCEDFLDGRAFVEAARTAGKPVVLMTVGRTEAGSRAARSHTGALTSGRDAIEAACRAAGIHLVDTPRGLVDVAQALLAPHRPRGRRIAVVGDGGGYGALASDLLGGRGVELPVLSERTQAALRELLPATASTGNPVDLAGAGEQDVFSFARSTGVLLDDDGIDAVLFTAYFGGYSTLASELGEHRTALERWIELASNGSDPAMTARCYLGASRAALRIVERREEALSLLDRARSQPTVDPVTAVEIEAHHANLLRLLEHRMDDAERVAAQAVLGARALRGQRDPTELSARERDAYATALQAAFDGAVIEDDASAMLRLAQEMAEVARGSEEATLSAALNLSLALWFLGRTGEAMDQARRTWVQSHERVLPMLTLAAGSTLASKLIEMGNLGEAEEVLSECVELERRIGERLRRHKRPHLRRGGTR